MAGHFGNLCCPPTIVHSTLVDLANIIQSVKNYTTLSLEVVKQSVSTNEV